jgi:hypothetical protein
LPNKCKCGEELYRVQGWITEPEGMRGNYFCPECNIMWEMHKHGLVKLGVLRSPYSTDLVSTIQNELQSMINELDKLKHSKNNGA